MTLPSTRKGTFNYDDYIPSAEPLIISYVFDEPDKCPALLGMSLNSKASPVPFFYVKLLNIVCDWGASIGCDETINWCLHILYVTQIRTNSHVRACVRVYACAIASDEGHTHTGSHEAISLHAQH